MSPSSPSAQARAAVVAQMRVIVEQTNALLTQTFHGIKVVRAETTTEAEVIRFTFEVEALPDSDFTADVVKTLVTPYGVAAVASGIARFHLANKPDNGLRRMTTDTPSAEEEGEEEATSRLARVVPAGRA